jgi:hypothetical protein
MPECRGNKRLLKMDKLYCKEYTGPLNWIGKNYMPDYDRVTVAEKIKADILAVWTGIKLSVTSDYKANHDFIYIRVIDSDFWPFANARESLRDAANNNDVILSEEFKGMMDVMKNIANSYTYNRQDHPFDYIHVPIWMHVNPDNDLVDNWLKKI